MSQTLQQQSLIFALSKCAIKISIEKLSEKFDCFVLKLVLCQQGRFSKIRSQMRSTSSVLDKRYSINFKMANPACCFSQSIGLTHCT